MDIELELVQHLLLIEAEDLANREVTNEDFRLKDGRLAMLHGQVFNADPVQSDKGGLCLSLDELQVRTLSQGSILRLHEIGLDAMREALIKNKEQFIGMILGEAREGRNYFDRFADDNQQMRLF